jgi:hypothetical protein
MQVAASARLVLTPLSVRGACDPSQTAVEAEKTSLEAMLAPSSPAVSVVRSGAPSSSRNGPTLASQSTARSSLLPSSSKLRRRIEGFCHTVTQLGRRSDHARRRRRREGAATSDLRAGFDVVRATMVLRQDPSDALPSYVAYSSRRGYAAPLHSSPIHDSTMGSRADRKLPSSAFV